MPMNKEQEHLKAHSIALLQADLYTSNMRDKNQAMPTWGKEERGKEKKKRTEKLLDHTENQDESPFPDEGRQESRSHQHRKKDNKKRIQYRIAKCIDKLQ